jgi:hypothetical protein
MSKLRCYMLVANITLPPLPINVVVLVLLCWSCCITSAQRACVERRPPIFIAMASSSHVKLEIKTEPLAERPTDIVEHLAPSAYERTMLCGVYTAGGIGGVDSTLDALIGTYRFQSVLNGRSTYRKVSGPVTQHDVRLYWSKNNWRLDGALFDGDLTTIAHGPSTGTSPMHVVEWHVNGVPIPFKIMHVVHALAWEVDRLKNEQMGDDETEPSSEVDMDGLAGIFAFPAPVLVPPRINLAPTPKVMPIGAPRHVPTVIAPRFPPSQPAAKRPRVRGGASIHARHIQDMLQHGATPTEVAGYVSSLHERKAAKKADRV